MAESPPPRTRLSVDERRRQLLRVGRRVFNERRYSEVPVEDIAREAGISPGLLYHYFPNKLDFFLACARVELDLFLDRVRATGDLPLVTRFEAALDAYLDFVTQESGGVLNVLREAAAHPRVAALADEARRKIMGEILGGAGVAQNPLLRVVIMGYQGFVEEATVEWLTHGGLDRDRFKALLQLVMRGLLTTVARLDPGPPATAREHARRD